MQAKSWHQSKNYLQTLTQIMVWLSVIILVIHALIFSPDRLDWIWRVIGGLFSALPISLIAAKTKASERIKAIAYPALVIVGETAAAIGLGGDPYYFIVLTACVIICAMYLDAVALMTLTGFIDLIIILVLIRIFGLRPAAGLTGDQLWMQTALLNFIAIVLLIFCRFSRRNFDEASQSSKTFDVIMDTTPSYLVIIDENARVTNISQTLVNALGATDRSFLVGMPLLDLFHSGEIKVIFQGIMESGLYIEKNIEVTVFGELRHYMVRSALMGPDGIARFFEWTDITPLIEARNDAINAAKSKSIFLANMSHEIRTPLNAIKGLSELMLLTKLDKTQKNYADNIIGASDSLLRIINDVLDFSKMDANKMELISTGYDFVSFVSDVLNVTNIKALEKGITLIADIDPDIPTGLQGDELRIKQILFNLISNAVKFTRDGSITLSVHVNSRQDDQVILDFAVTDTGIGIKQEDIDTLFLAFQQMDTVKNKGIVGTGLGLAISKALVEMMGGSVSVTSVYGQGSTFAFSIPQTIVHDVPIARLSLTTDVRLLILGDGLRGQHACHIAEQLGLAYRHIDDPSNTALLEQYLRSGPTHILYFYAAWHDVLREKGVYQLHDFDLIAVKDIRYASAQQTPPHVKFLFLPLLISALAHLINHSDAQTTVGRVIPAENTLGYFDVLQAQMLVVDDNKVNLMVCGAIFKHYHIDPDFAQSGHEAIQKCQEKKYDIIFMDHMMPGMDGVEATLAIQSGNGPNRDTPIVALTANAVSGMREIFLDNGMSDFISKPIETKELNRVFKRFIPAERIVITYHMDPPPALPNVVLNEKALAFLRIGVDFESAVAAIGGDATAYYQVLDTLLTTTPHRLELLQGYFHRLADAEVGQADEARRSFKIEIHALKGALANIGAAVLSQQAKVLETAAEKAADTEDNRNFIADRFPVFSDNLRALLSALPPLMPCAPSEGPLSQGDATMLVPQLTQVLDLMDRLEIEAAQAIVEDLQRYTYSDDIDRMMSAAHTSILSYDFDQASAHIHQILDRLNP